MFDVNADWFEGAAKGLSPEAFWCADRTGESKVRSWINRASVTGWARGGPDADVVSPIVGASGSTAGFGFGLSWGFDTAGLGSSLGAGEGRTL